jgi:osmotically inducible protein OsmC
MITRKSSAQWQGPLNKGKGTMKLASGAFEGAYSFASRFEQGEGTNPEELIGAAHAGCFSMALAHGLAQAGYFPKNIETTASVALDKVGEGFRITGITLNTTAEVPEISEETFLEQAETAKNNCPVSVALAGTEISLQAKLTSPVS